MRKYASAASPPEAAGGAVATASCGGPRPPRFLISVGRTIAQVFSTTLSVLVACGPERREGIGEASGGLVMCPSGATAPGIDVSVYQGGIDWNRVAASGIA